MKFNEAHPSVMIKVVSGEHKGRIGIINSVDHSVTQTNVKHTLNVMDNNGDKYFVDIKDTEILAGYRN